MNSNFRRITINLSQLEDTNFFGSTVDEIDDLKPKWIAAMEHLAARDGVDLLLSHGNIGAVPIMEIDGFDRYTEGPISDTAEGAWFDAASVNAWEIVHATQDAE